MKMSGGYGRAAFEDAALFASGGRLAGFMPIG
jgi:hypothetical protein